MRKRENVLQLSFNCAYAPAQYSQDLSVAFPRSIYEPPHDKTNKMACAPSKDSDQPGHLHSLISVFNIHMKKYWALNYLADLRLR